MRHRQIVCSADKNLCPFCFEDVGHFSRHLFRKHSDEKIVNKIESLPVKSKERREAISALRKKGNFILMQQKNNLKPTKKPTPMLAKFLKDKENIKEEYFPCVNCLGFYRRTYLWRHKKKCRARLREKSAQTKTQHLSEAQTFLAIQGFLGDYLNKSRLKKEVLDIMRPDMISRVVKNDPLICYYGESYLNKHKRKQINTVASNKIREMGRLKIALTNSIGIKNLIEVLKPEMYDHIIAAAKIITGFDAENRIFKASSLALHLGTNLKFLCDVARKVVVTKNPLFPTENRDEVQKNILELRDMINSHWCNDISSLANKVLIENKYSKPKLLPLTEDLLIFNNFVTRIAEESFEKLKNNENIEQNYKLLSESLLSIVLIFNKKRIGEVQFLEISAYEKNQSFKNQEEFLNSLSELEKTMSTSFKRVVVFGKGSKPVPILFTKQMQKYIDLLIKTRRASKIVPEANKYIFANPGSNRWMSGSSVIRKLAYKSGAKHPELLTSTKFRKQIATILQLMHFDSDEMEQIARFMGHTEKTHKEFYR